MKPNHSPKPSLVIGDVLVKLVGDRQTDRQTDRHFINVSPYVPQVKTNYNTLKYTSHSMLQKTKYFDNLVTRLNTMVLALQVPNNVLSSTNFPPGVAVALLLMTFFRCLTHGLELSYGLYFMFASLRQPFPWSDDHMNITVRLVNLNYTRARMYVLMYDYIYVLFVCRVWLYIHRHTGTGD